MKRLLFLLSFAIVLSPVGFAQKSNVSKAKNKALTTENPDLVGAKELIEAALVDNTTKDLANTWYVAGLVYETSANSGIDSDAPKAFEYYLKAYELDQLPNAKGKVAPKFNKKIAASMNAFYRDNKLVNSAITAYNEKNYEEAVKVFNMYTSIPDLPVLAGEKVPLTKDPENYYQWRYFTASSEYMLGNIPAATLIYEDIKDKGYEEDRIYQYLYDIYKNGNDTTNFVRILQGGIQRFPSDFFFLGTLINYYVYSGQKGEANMYLDRAIASDPTNAQYYYVKGTLLEEDKDSEGASKMFDKAIEINATNSDYWVAKGRVIYNKAFALESDATSMKDYKAADAQIAKAHEIYKESLPFFEKAAELNSSDYDNLKILRSLYYKLQSSDKSYEAKYNKIVDMLNQ